MKNGRVQRIGTVAIEIDKLSQRLSGKISDGIKLQKFLDAMHPEHRYALEPHIDKEDFQWTEVVKQAEKNDDALFQAGKYGRQGRESNESNAISSTTPNQKKGKPNKKQYPPRQGNEQLYQQRRRDKLCYFCGKKGHMIAQCNTRKNKDQQGNQKKVSSNFTEIEDQNDNTFEEFLESFS